MNDLTNLTNCHPLTPRTCSVPQDRFEDWIKHNCGGKIDLSRYSVREFGAIELFSEDAQKGYVFVPEFPSGKDRGDKVSEIARFYGDQGLRTMQIYEDGEPIPIGFSWSK